ncbi:MULTISPECIES: FRG domain-containing protein [unclassified Mesorhizobium]|uniref:FRG domain-containing protein n=1 Tax=unclassified Mesorhizobium TaxID=325217 RepID=UPI000FDB78A7|nr:MULTISPECIES: FRG domain-containing protein [unclassified Mesorhizobium]TGQ12190.1 FRG domain-containing protein [Mesorhizobium sp. M2E.F.Ca.ET.219.01.1.1]TGT68012.1 FRG domain-containing protein [Mesorhizobium sp. M2E.F.Ca.ET.166.01.1.1]TGW01013.1 FRG domain-containing protein [Mesorhizobium sp. M2E.F.Ca.ET.154.01.1.1]
MNDLPERKIIEHLQYSDANRFLSELLSLQESIPTQQTPLIYRGSAIADWGLVPSAFRPQGVQRLERLLALDVSTKFANDSSLHKQIVAEFTAVRLFYKFANHQGIARPSVSDEIHHLLMQSAFRMNPKSFMALVGAHFWKWPPPDLRPIIGLAQHYGVPTRLLDWSRDMLVAAYFAAKSALEFPIEGNLAVWIASPDILEAHNLPLVMEMPSYSYQIDVVEVPYAGNPNLAAQKGLFTNATPTRPRIQELGHAPEQIDLVHAVSTLFSQSKGSAVDGMVNRRPKPDDLLPPMFFKATLPRSEAKPLLRLLRSRGYDGARLFPGLKGCEISMAEMEVIY